MKKITFILLALISGTAFAQNTAEGTATVNALIVSPIGVSTSDNIDFGKIVKTEAGGTVVIPTNGGERVISDAMDIASTPATAATFAVTAEENTTYSVSIPQLTIKNTTDETQTMTVDFDHSLNEGSNSSTGNTAATFVVGGTLNVGGNQKAGSYTGTATVTVSYE
jgi:spore coat protein U-like protein